MRKQNPSPELKLIMMREMSTRTRGLLRSTGISKPHRSVSVSVTADLNDQLPIPILNLHRQMSREAKLTAHRNHKMARSVHAFVRGNTIQFYEWLEG